MWRLVSALIWSFLVVLIVGTLYCLIVFPLPFHQRASAVGVVVVAVGLLSLVVYADRRDLRDERWLRRQRRADLLAEAWLEVARARVHYEARGDTIDQWRATGAHHAFCWYFHWSMRSRGLERAHYGLSAPKPILTPQPFIRRTP